MAVLELENVCKSFPRGFFGRRHRVLDNLSLRVEAGEFFGLLGHNGAGKTTTMRIILGLARPDSGVVRTFGRAMTPAARSRIGYLGDEVGLYPFLTAEETLSLTGRLFRMTAKAIRERSRSLLEAVKLDAEARLRVKHYSKGMRQRLGIATALMNDPELVILDEPYSGLDPVGRRQVREVLLSLKSRGKTIILSSHIVPDVEAVCDRVGILAGGQVARCLALKEIYAHKSAPVEIMVRGVDARRFARMTPPVERVYSNPGATVIRCSGKDHVREIVSKVYASGGDVLEIRPLKFNLEDYLVEALDAEPKDRPLKELREERELSYARD